MTRSNRRAHQRRPGGEPVSRVYARYHGCGRKVGYPDEESARLAAWAQRAEESEPVPYECPHGCGMLHLAHDRESRAERWRRRRAERRPWPREVLGRSRRDPVEMAELGERALSCGCAESSGFTSRTRTARMGVIARRGRRAAPPGDLRTRRHG